MPGSHLTSKDTNPIMCLTLCSPSTLQIYKRGRNINRLTIAIPCPKARLCLGLPNPPMIDIAEETSGFRRSWLSQDLRLLIPTFSLLNAPVDFTVGLHCIKNAPLPLGGFVKRRMKIRNCHLRLLADLWPSLALPPFTKPPNSQFRYKA